MVSGRYPGGFSGSLFMAHVYPLFECHDSPGGEHELGCYLSGGQSWGDVLLGRGGLVSALGAAAVDELLLPAFDVATFPRTIGHKRKTPALAEHTFNRDGAGFPLRPKVDGLINPTKNAKKLPTSRNATTSFIFMVPGLCGVIVLHCAD